MTYIIHYRQRERDVFYTVDPEHLTVKFREVHRRVGRTRLGPIVEPAGLDKSMVHITARTDDIRTSRGTLRGLPWMPIKLLDRNRAIRILRESDQAALAEIDTRIEAKQAELKALREERHAAVANAWRNGAKVDISELEEKASNA